MKLFLILLSLVTCVNAIMQGEKELVCVGIHYQDMNRYVSASECQSVANQVSQFYLKNSRGLLKLKAEGHDINVDLNGNRKNVDNAERLATRKYPSKDFWIIPSIFTGSHASGNIAHVPGTQVNTATHETGHLLGLEHAGEYSFDNGKINLDDYGDHESVMSRYASSWLTAPQYFHQGWIPQDEIEYYTEPKSYTLKRINDFNTKGISVVIVKRPDRDAFISFATGCEGGCISLHLGLDGGSQKIKNFGKEFHDIYLTGLYIKILEYKDGFINISVE